MLRSWMVALGAVCVGAALCLAYGPAGAFEEDEMKTLLETKGCPRCDLSGTDLSGADMSAASVEDAMLDKAVFCRTKMPDNTLNLVPFTP